MRFAHRVEARLPPAMSGPLRGGAVRALRARKRLGEVAGTGQSGRLRDRMRRVQDGVAENEQLLPALEDRVGELERDVAAVIERWRLNRSS